MTNAPHLYLVTEKAREQSETRLFAGLVLSNLAMVALAVLGVVWLIQNV
jgi:hypothetical protein